MWLSGTLCWCEVDTTLSSVGPQSTLNGPDTSTQNWTTQKHRQNNTSAYSEAHYAQTQRVLYIFKNKNKEPYLAQRNKNIITNTCCQTPVSIYIRDFLFVYSLIMHCADISLAPAYVSVTILGLRDTIIKKN